MPRQHERAADSRHGLGGALADLDDALAGEVVFIQHAGPARAAVEVSLDATLRTRAAIEHLAVAEDRDRNVGVFGRLGHDHVGAEVRVNVRRLDVHEDLAQVHAAGSAVEFTDVGEQGVAHRIRDDRGGGGTAAIGRVGHHLRSDELDIASEDRHATSKNL